METQEEFDKRQDDYWTKRAARSVVFRDITLARDAADEKWGRLNGDKSFPADRPFLAQTILAEEAGEVANAVLEGDEENLQAELIDVLQVATAWLEQIYRQKYKQREQGVKA